MRQISSCIFVSRRGFGEGISFVDEKKSATPFHQNMPVRIKQIMSGKPFTTVVYLLQSIVYDQIEETSSNGLMAATLKDCRLENMECSEHQLIFVTTGEVV